MIEAANIVAQVLAPRENSDFSPSRREQSEETLQILPQLEDLEFCPRACLNSRSDHVQPDFGSPPENEMGFSRGFQIANGTAASCWTGCTTALVRDTVPSRQRQEQANRAGVPVQARKKSPRSDPFPHHTGIILPIHGLRLIAGGRESGRRGKSRGYGADVRHSAHVFSRAQDSQIGTAHTIGCRPDISTLMDPGPWVAGSGEKPVRPGFADCLSANCRPGREESCARSHAVA